VSDITPEDALQVAQRALEKVLTLEGEIEDLQAKHAEAEEELTALRLRLQEQDEDRPYESLTLDEKVGMVREHGYRKALNGHGKTTLDYDDIMWEVFSGKPGTKHCYKLIRLAAGVTGGEDAKRPTGGEVPGFRARDPAGDNFHLAVDAEAAQQGAAFFPENKTATEGVR